MTETKLRETDGIAIFVTDQGRFAAMIDGKRHERMRLADLEGLIQKAADPLQGIEYGSPTRGSLWLIDWPSQVKVKGFSQRGAPLLMEGLRVGRNGRVYAYDPAVFAELMAVKEEAEAKWQEWHKRIRDALAETYELKPAHLRREP